MGQCYECKDAFPYIQEVIESLCQRSGEAEHDAIVDELMKHPEASGIIGRATERCPKLTRLRIASNMVQFMSQHYTMDREDAVDFQERFRRRKDSAGDWAYSLR
jgi:hypothetical protein